MDNNIIYFVIKSVELKVSFADGRNPSQQLLCQIADHCIEGTDELLKAPSGYMRCSLSSPFTLREELCISVTQVAQDVARYCTILFDIM
ncbi:hypothetical protein AVEN_247925-1 [Araneus ventricosus]|uniref:Uncharacterized protein n=1 Tax=Araneus ventricosus TaxID=182803 RepID=A0A4Y2CJY9_ARAVE|nr:hypothetical protein AVEN_247925-1 [Araneus ventricosus]